MAAQAKLFLWQRESAVMHLIFEIYNKNDKDIATKFLNIGTYSTLSTTHFRNILTFHKYSLIQEGLKAYQPFGMIGIKYGQYGLLRFIELY